MNARAPRVYIATTRPSEGEIIRDLLEKNGIVVTSIWHDFYFAGSLAVGRATQSLQRAHQYLLADSDALLAWGNSKMPAAFCEIGFACALDKIVVASHAILSDAPTWDHSQSVVHAETLEQALDIIKKTDPATGR